jgi:hypothetical protein
MWYFIAGFVAGAIFEYLWLLFYLVFHTAKTISGFKSKP